MAIIKLSSAERRRASAFFTCLVLAVAAWIIVMLSNPYNYVVNQVLTYKNVPQKRAFHALQSDTVSTTVKGNGWQMLFSKMKTDRKPLKVDLQNLESENYVVLSTQLNTINETKDANSKIVSFNPDTLYFDFTNRSTRRVPVQLAANITYQHQFAQSDNVVINPAYVTISGPSNRIDKILVWKTDSLLVNDVNETINTRVNIAPVKEGSISIYPKSVQVIVPVNEFTEKTIEMPVKLINNYEFYNVKVFPQKVKVTFTTSLNKYAAMTEDLFEADADFDMWKKHGNSVLPVTITKTPDFCRIVKVEPANIDFIIKQ